MKSLTIKFLLLFLLIESYSFAQDRTTGRTFTSRSEVMGVKGMIASSHPLVSQVGLTILQKGGNAIDAAIAANALQGFVDPSMNGIGGDLFAIIWHAKTNKLYGLNASGRSPELLTLEYFQDKDLTRIPRYGALSVSVPGCVDGWFEMNKKFGKMKMEELLAPAINYARDGFPLAEEAANTLARLKPESLPSSNFKKLYFPKNRVIGKGEIFKNPDLANSLSLISKKGREGFYNGEVAKSIEAHIKKKVDFFLSVIWQITNPNGWNRSQRITEVMMFWNYPPTDKVFSGCKILKVLEGFNFKKIWLMKPLNTFTHFEKGQNPLGFEKNWGLYLWGNPGL